MSLNFPLQEIAPNWIDKLLGEGALLEFNIFGEKNGDMEEKKSTYKTH